LDFFAGSGTTGVVAGELGRNFTLIDSSHDALRTITERLSSRGLLFETLEK
jgi:site-specific DNA-methyltransferase (adenine-specific)